MPLAHQVVGDGFPILLIHAFPLNRKMWKGQIGPLSQAGFQIVLPDLPGFGETVVNKNVSIPDMAEEIFGLIKFLKIEGCIVGGLSMGGYVSFALSKKHPRIFSGLLLCDTTFSADSTEKKEARFNLIEKIASEGPLPLARDMLPNLISDHTKENNPVLVNEIKKEILQTDPEGAIAALKAMANREDQTDLLGEISVPTGLIFGEADKVTNLETAKIMKNQIPFSELFIIEKAGHYSNLEQSEKFNAALLEFVKTGGF
ncbi:MAG: alpha/beta hydrolase [Pyrinomonadaceae bacterium]